MYPPVGHQSTSIIPIPTKIKVKSIGVKRAFGSRPQPKIIINSAWYWAVRCFVNSRYPVDVSPCFDGTYTPQFSGPHVLMSVLQMGQTALPLPNLYHSTRASGSQFHRTYFGNGIANGFFDIHIFSCGNCIQKL